MKEIALTKGYVAIVSDEDYDRINANKWHAVEGWGPHVAASRWLPKQLGKRRKATTIAHDVLGVARSEIKPLVVDHINGNELDNRRENLRLVNRQQNAQNSNRVRNYTGVYFEACRNRWKAFLLNGDRTREYLGTYRTENEATLAQQLAREGKEICDLSKLFTPTQSDNNAAHRDIQA